MDDCLNISIFGLGKVGLTLAACLSASGHRVIGVDLDAALVSSINDLTVQSDEPGVVDRILASNGRLTATIDPIDAVKSTDLSIIIVPTPSNAMGGFSLRYILKAIESIGAGIQSKKGAHVVSVMSTVLPRSSDQIIIPHLELCSKRKIGAGLGYCYNPSFIAIGSVVKNIEQPDYLLIGEADSSSGDLVLRAHLATVPKKTPVARMLPVEAELTKLASNTHDTMRVSFANMLSAACYEIPGANVDRITNAMVHHVGMRFFKGAVPFGGPCWPRDNRALSLFLGAIGCPNEMPRTVDDFNDQHGIYILNKILELIEPNKTIGIIGLAYKPGTSLVESSFAMDLIGWLLSERRSVIAWDPKAASEARKVWGDKIGYAKSGNQCLKEASHLVIVNPLKEIHSLDWSNAKDKIVIDCWRCLDSSQQTQIGRYVPLGQGERDKKLEISPILMS